MMDLIYIEPADYSKLWDAIAGRFPAAKLEDASDAIHDRRFSVELPDSERDEYLRFALAEGFGACSLSIGMMASSEPVELKALIRASHQSEP